MKKKTRYPGVTRLGEGRYRIRVQLRKTNSRPRKEVDRVVHCRNIGEAKAERERLIALDARDQVQRVTLRAFASLWLESKLRSKKLGQSTTNRYVTALELHILPELGDVYLDSLTRWKIEHWKANAKGEPITVNGWLRVLRSILAAAVPEYVASNPAEKVEYIEEVEYNEDEEDDANTLTEAELVRLLKAFRDHEPEHYPLMLASAMTGLRFGEVSALKWKDLDHEKGVIRVRRAQWHGYIKLPKTKKRRKVPLPPTLMAVLDDWRAKLVREQRPGLDAGWVFPAARPPRGAPKPGQVRGLRYSSGLTKPMRRALKVAKIDRRVTPSQGVRRSAEDVLRRLEVKGPLAEAVMGHNSRMRTHYSTVADHEVASIGPRIVEAIGLEQKFVGDRVGDHALETENA